MQKKLWISIQLFIILTFMVGLLSPVSAPQGRIVIQAHPQLVQAAAENPMQTVSVIVQKLRQGNELEAEVSLLGGKVTKDLHIINAFAAEMTGEAAIELAHDPRVRWISPNGPVISTGKPNKNTATFILFDTFSTPDFNNNDGVASWTTDWIEDDVAGAGPTTGNVFTFDGELFLQDQPDTGTFPSAARQADLSDGIISAMLSYSFRLGPGVEAGEESVVFEVSTNGGATYTTLSTYNQFNGGTTGTAYRNILAYASQETRFRFRISNGYDDPNEYFALDNFKIEYVGNALPNITYLDTLKVRNVWDLGYTGAGIGVAVIDSGISQDRDFTSIQKLSFNPNSNTVNDFYGHGTHVAGIIAGNGTDSGGVYKGIAPNVNLISLKICDETGMAYESDAVEAMQWLLEHKEQYNIRVVNISLNSSVEQSYHFSPLNAAAEILWFSGVVVVTSAGNYWDDSGINPILAAPANDPFVITVGATDEKGTARRQDDIWANFSAFGNTQDGFYKPEIYAPGKDIISVLSKDSSWDTDYPEREIFGGQFFRISGTSMAAPMVSGAVALMLQADPTLTPDQVKYRLINTATWLGPAKYMDVEAAVTGTTTESANTGINASQLLWTGEEPITWDSVAWNSVAWNSVAWNSVAWNSVAWNSVAWNSLYWGE